MLVGGGCDPIINTQMVVASGRSSWECSSVAERMTVNHDVIGSNPIIPVFRDIV